MNKKLQLLQSVAANSSTVFLYAKGHTNGLFFRQLGLGTMAGNFSVLYNSKNLGNISIVNELSMNEMKSISNIEHGNVNYDFGAILSNGASTGSTLSTFLGVDNLPLLTSLYEYAYLPLGSIYFNDTDSVQVTVDNSSAGILEVYSYETNDDIAYTNKYTKVSQTSQTFENVNKIYMFPVMNTKNPFTLNEDYNVTISDAIGENTAKASAWVDFTNAECKIEGIPEPISLLYDGVDTRVNVLVTSSIANAPTLVGVSRMSTAPTVKKSIQTIQANNASVLRQSGSNTLARSIIQNKTLLGGSSK